MVIAKMSIGLINSKEIAKFAFGGTDAICQRYLQCSNERLFKRT